MDLATIERALGHTSKLDPSEPLEHRYKRQGYVFTTKSVSAGNSYSLHSYGASYLVFYDEESRKKTIHGSGICHGSLSSMRSKTDNGRTTGDAPIVAVKTKLFSYKDKESLAKGHWPEMYTDEFIISFYDWLINRSVFSLAFPHKDVLDAIEHGLIVDPKAPMPYFLGGLITSRILTESFVSGQNYAMCQLMNRGVDPHLAIGMSYGFSRTKATNPDGYTVFVYKHNRTSGGAHQPFNFIKCTTSNLKQLFSPQQKRAEKFLPYLSNAPWGGVHNLFSGDSEPTLRYCPYKQFSAFCEESLRMEAITVGWEIRYQLAETWDEEAYWDKLAKWLINLEKLLGKPTKGEE